jgi:O-antigen/teichoic acid export membrane protein
MKQSSFIKNVLTRFLLTLPVRFRGLIILPLLTRLYSSDIFGAWLQVIIISEILKNLLSLQLGPAIVRYLSGEEQSKETVRSVLTITIGVAAVFIIISIFFSEPICRLVFGSASFKPLLIISSIWIFIQSCMVVGLSVLRSMEKIATFSVREIISAAWMVVAVMIAFQYKLTLEQLVTLCVVGDSVLLVWILLQIDIANPFISPRMVKNALKKFLPFSTPLIFSALFLWITRSLDRFLIVQILGLSDVAIYGVSYQIASILFIVLKPINFVLFPRTSNSWNQGNKEEVSKYFSQAVLMTVAFSLPLLVGIHLTSEGVIRILAGNTYISDSSVTLMLLLACMASMIYQNHLFIIQLVEKTYLLPILFVFTACLNFTLGYFFICQFGLLGASISRFITLTLMAGIVTLWTRKYIKFQLNPSLIFKIALASMVMGLTIKWMPMGSWQWLALKICLGASVFFISLVFLRVITKDNLIALKNQF